MHAIAAIAGALLLAAPAARAQDSGAVAVDQLVRSLGMTARVLMIGAHPDDEDTELLTYLARGRGARTAYLSLTRGDGGQNLIGNELFEALGVIRTEELLAARRVDGAEQYFTRAYDFGFSKTAEETYRHWPKDSVLGDVVRVVRSFRPHVIIAVFSGTPRDGHGHHQVSGLLAREAYDASMDTTRFPVATHGAAWTAAKFYRAARFRANEATLSFDVGGYDAVRGRGWAEVAAESRSQHKSQGFGTLQRKGALVDHVIREATRVNADVDAKAERDLFDGIDTSWARVAEPDDPEFGPLAAYVAQLRGSLDLRDPWRAVATLPPDLALPIAPVPGGADQRALDHARTAEHAAWQLIHLVRHASGVDAEASAPSAVVATDAPFEVRLTVYNRRDVPLVVQDVFRFRHWSPLDVSRLAVAALPSEIPPHGQATFVVPLTLREASRPWWTSAPRIGDLWGTAIAADGVVGDAGGPVVPVEDQRHAPLQLALLGRFGSAPSPSPAADSLGVGMLVPVVYRFADPVKGDQQVPVLAAPTVTLTLDREEAYVRAGAPVRRTLRVTVRSAARDTLDARVALELPPGLAADAAARIVRLAPGGVGTAEFTVAGTLRAGTHRVIAVATIPGDTTRYATGYTRIAYDHIRPQHLYRNAAMTLHTVDVALPARARIAYVPGVGDNVLPMLADLGLDVVRLEPATIGAADLSRFTAIVIGPRAYQASPELVAQRSRLFDWARRGGTLVMQYGQYELLQPGMLPYPITLARPHDRVTEEDAPVTVLAPRHPVLASPNRITSADFEGWVQERALYMPRTHDAAYTALLSMHDAGEPSRDGALLVAPLGRGTFVYTTLAFFRQLPAGHPGAARLFVNLLAAKAPAGAVP
jgi:LmbE family N-acetylglucosaminyl deacetylase